ncbi:hypothetical protein [Carnobacterium sp. FSL W8-0810]|uniref:hypothetical protein n=1 Tax=Carnobacterium sp. FSL W8-0810 TaxID=2954705 RepID=UPI0030F8ABE0
MASLALVGCSAKNNGEEASIEQDSGSSVSSELAVESIESESVNEKRATYNLESGEETAEFFSDYFGTQMEVSIYDFEDEQETNYMYSEIFTLSADSASDAVEQITFFALDKEEVRDILKIADFPENPVIEEALSFEGELKNPTSGDFYSTEYYDDLGLGANITIKGTIWGDEEEKPYSLTLFYDKKAYDKYAG